MWLQEDQEAFDAALSLVSYILSSFEGHVGTSVQANEQGRPIRVKIATGNSAEQVSHRLLD